MSDIELACARYRAAEAAYDAAAAELRLAADALRRCIRAPSRRVCGTVRLGRVSEVATIIEVAAAYHGVTVAEIVGDSRLVQLVKPRHRAMRVARELVKVSLETLGAEFGGRDHGTILNACAAVDGYCSTDPKYRADFEAFASQCRQALGLERVAS